VEKRLHYLSGKVRKNQEESAPEIEPTRLVSGGGGKGECQYHEPGLSPWRRRWPEKKRRTGYRLPSGEGQPSIYLGRGHGQWVKKGKKGSKRPVTKNKGGEEAAILVFRRAEKRSISCLLRCKKEGRTHILATTHDLKSVSPTRRKVLPSSSTEGKGNAMATQHQKNKTHLH